MNRWQAKTCLRFRYRTSQSDYIEFTADNSNPRCFSTFIGKQGGRQRIQLGPGCRSEGITMHEIGHAIGLWHEQSRPDRDRYVGILWDNIADGSDADSNTVKERNQFKKRTRYEVDHYGSTYDYGSIMHYRRTAFGKGKTTIVVRNNAEYIRQGRPTLGQRSHLSRRDTKQVSRMYNCPRTGIRGYLNVYLRFARKLPDTDHVTRYPDPYVRVTAVDDSRNKVTKLTVRKPGTLNPTWNQMLKFGRRRWQYIEVSIWDKDSGKDDRMTATQSFSVSPGSHKYIKHCRNKDCKSYMYFDYELDTSGVVGVPGPRQ